MGAGERRKGARAEVEVYHHLHEVLGDLVSKRDLSQARDRGGDLRIPRARVVVEVKRTQSRSVPAWLRQSAASALQRGKTWTGAVAWRPDRADWRYFLPARDGYRTLTLEEFVQWVTARLR